nr:hemerythrin domain-containing protein [Longitalea luteola]
MDAGFLADYIYNQHHNYFYENRDIILQLVARVRDRHMAQGPLAMMHMEHEIAGDILKTIRTITNDYHAPEGACNTYRLLYHKLQELENDLHLHIHLENNILFLKAMQLEKELIG